MYWGETCVEIYQLDRVFCLGVCPRLFKEFVNIWIDKYISCEQVEI